MALRSLASKATMLRTPKQCTNVVPVAPSHHHLSFDIAQVSFVFNRVPDICIHLLCPWFGRVWNEVFAPQGINEGVAQALVRYVAWVTVAGKRLGQVCLITML